MNTFARAFAGTADCEGEGFHNWFLGPEYSRVDDDEVGVDDQRWRLIRMCMTYAVYQYGIFPKFGEILEVAGQRPECVSVSGNEGRVFPVGENSNGSSIPAALACVRFYPSGYRNGFCDKYWWPLRITADLFLGNADSKKKFLPEMYAPTPKKGAELAARRKELARRAKGFQERTSRGAKVLDAEHLRLMGRTTPHVYVTAIAVLPEAQGRGLCSKLMRGINSVADDLGLPCYLECVGEGHVAIYEGFGYEVASRVEISADFDTDKTVWPSITCCAMIRQPKLSASSS